MYFYTTVCNIKGKIGVVGYKNGKRFTKLVDFQPTLYVPTNNESKYKTLQDKNVDPIKFDNIWDCRAWIKKYKDVQGFHFYGNTNFATQYAVEEFGQDFKYDTSLINIGKFDIETDSENGFPSIENPDQAITSIAYTDNSGIYHTWGLKEYDINKSILEYPTKDNIRYYHCKDEEQLLRTFISYWNSNCPDVITGWYIRLFDIPYMIRRMYRVVGEAFTNSLSPFGVINQKNIFIQGKEFITYDIPGVQQLDYMDLFKKFGYAYGTQESYRLDAIATVVLGDKKISYEEYGSLAKLYNSNHQLFIDYNIKDTALIERLDEKLDYIKLAITIAYRASANFANAFGTVAIWDSMTYKYLHSQNIVIPNEREHDRPEIAGAYVKSPIIGKHNWVVSFDLNSLYPNLIIQYNMSPETITGKVESNYSIEKLLDKQLENETINCIAANGVHFSKQKQGFIPKLIKQLYEERVVIKKKMIELKKKNNKKNDTEILQLESNQMAIKILMNSLYGAMGNVGFRYFDHRIASAITSGGQLSIKWAEKAINSYIQKILKTEDDYVIAIDTDSLYIRLDSLVEKAGKDLTTEQTVDLVNKICVTKIEPIIEQAFADLHDYMKSYENRMVMKREAIASSGVWVAKKRYILNVYDNEGVRFETPKLKIMGIEAVKSSTPQICREKMKDAFKIIISGSEDEMQSFIKQFKQEFSTYDADVVAFPRGVSNLEKYSANEGIYGLRTPIHARGSLLFNHYIKQMNLDTQLEQIQSGDKIKFVYLKTPNPIKENVIAFPQFLPEQLIPKTYIDYNQQFNKAFLEPLKTILHAIGWHEEKQSSLMNFFN